MLIFKLAQFTNSKETVSCGAEPITKSNVAKSKTKNYKYATEKLRRIFDSNVFTTKFPLELIRIQRVSSSNI